MPLGQFFNHQEGLFNLNVSDKHMISMLFILINGSIKGISKKLGAHMTKIESVYDKNVIQRK